jgi:hypothetical protein
MINTMRIDVYNYKRRIREMNSKRRYYRIGYKNIRNKWIRWMN